MRTLRLVDKKLIFHLDTLISSTPNIKVRNCPLEIISLIDVDVNDIFFYFM